MASVKWAGSLDVSKIAHSSELSQVLEPLARRVFDDASTDPNEAYVKSLRIYEHHSKGRLGRVSWRVGAHPVIGPRVEAVRGTLARALGRAGLTVGRR